MKNVLISIKRFLSTEQADEECFEFVTDGEYSLEDGVAEFSYQESDLTGDFAGTKTSFVVEPDRVILSWAGGINEMIFNESRKHHFVYETSYGSLTMGLDTQSIVKKMDENGGNLEIHYIIDVDNVVISRNSFKINVR